MTIPAAAANRADQPAVIARAAIIRSINETTRTVDFVASTDAIDSYGESVCQDNWQLERYLSNPVALFAHMSRELPIGHSTRCEVTTDNGKKQLECSIQFSTAEANPLAEQVWQSLRQKSLRTVSVGFIPHTIRWEKRGDQEIYVLDDCELFEISVTPVPANPEALAKMRARARETATQATSATQRESETTMLTEKEIQDLRDKSSENAALKAVAEKAASDATEKLASVTLERDANAIALKSVTTERDAAVVAQKAANESLALAQRTITEHGVDSLIGKKFAPTEREVMVELAVSNPALYEKTVKARPDMHLLDNLAGTEKATPSTAGAASGDAFAAANAVTES